ncbi:MAG: imidazoleglycerol-phosphate dehydratase, partial [Clostridia bacterium]|nr:imidazoleglycerol-phosphate dehydratase [Clostridia bacterium]
MAKITRKTKETDIELTLQLDGGEVDISTGVGFFDHMLTALAVHGGFGLQLKTVGDWHVDCHHTVEDTGIVLCKAFKEALSDRSGIVRYGNAMIPMDEALGFCAVDVSGRPFLVFDADFPQERVGDFDTCMTEEFFRA